MHVVNETDDPTASISYGDLKTGVMEVWGSYGGLGVATTLDLVLTTAPDSAALTCARGTGGQQDQPVSLRVVDPGHSYREVDPVDVLGCRFTSGISDGPYESGDTAEAAARALAATLGPVATFTRASGYAQQRGPSYLVHAGSTRGLVGVEEFDGKREASLVEQCDPTEDVAPASESATAAEE